MKNKNFIVVAIAALMAIAIMTSCSKSSNKSTNPNPPPGNQVTIANFAFSPGTITVTAGSTVTWKNNDSTPHTVTSDQAGMFDSGPIATGGTFQFQFPTAGTFSYHCTIHPTMAHASVAVQ